MFSPFSLTRLFLVFVVVGLLVCVVWGGGGADVIIVKDAGWGWRFYVNSSEKQGDAPRCSLFWKTTPSM